MTILRVTWWCAADGTMYTRDFSYNTYNVNCAYLRAFADWAEDNDDDCCAIHSVKLVANRVVVSKETPLW